MRIKFNKNDILFDMILYGAPIKEKIKKDLIKRIKILNKKLVLAIVQVGDREDSNIYIRQKQKFGDEIGVQVEHTKITPSGDEIQNEKTVLNEIKRLNKNKNIFGIIVQLPLPENFDTQKILNSIDPKKDADGLTNRKTIPATARAVLELLNFYNFELKNKKVAVIGQSILAGKPIADELEKRGAEVIRCDINTKNIPEIAKESEILVSAVGKPNLITKEFTNEKQIIIDVGIVKTDNGVKGDVCFNEILPFVYAITPVPGGVGPLTVACLFLNLLDLA